MACHLYFYLRPVIGLSDDFIAGVMDQDGVLGLNASYRRVPGERLARLNDVRAVGVSHPIALDVTRGSALMMVAPFTLEAFRRIPARKQIEKITRFYAGPRVCHKIRCDLEQRLIAPLDFCGDRAKVHHPCDGDSQSPAT